MNKQTKAEKKAEKARNLAIRNTADKFIQTCVNGHKTVVFNRKILRNQLRRFVGNKLMKPVFEYIQKHYSISLVG